MINDPNTELAAIVRRFVTGPDEEAGEVFAEIEGWCARNRTPEKAEPKVIRVDRSGNPLVVAPAAWTEEDLEYAKELVADRKREAEPEVARVWVKLRSNGKLKLSLANATAFCMNYADDQCFVPESALDALREENARLRGFVAECHNIVNMGGIMIANPRVSRLSRALSGLDE